MCSCPPPSTVSADPHRTRPPSQPWSLLCAPYPPAPISNCVKSRCAALPAVRCIRRVRAATPPPQIALHRLAAVCTLQRILTSRSTTAVLFARYLQAPLRTVSLHRRRRMHARPSILASRLADSLLLASSSTTTDEPPVPKPPLVLATAQNDCNEAFTSI